MAAHVRRTRGGQSGLGGDGAIQPGEWRVKPIFCHLFLLPWTYPAGKCNQLLTHRHRRAEIRDWFGKTASEMFNFVGIAEWHCCWEWGPRRGEYELGSWAACHPGDPCCPSHSLPPVGPIHTPWGSWRNMPRGQPRSLVLYSAWLLFED